MGKQSFWFRLFLAVLSGVLASMAFAPFGLEVLILGALTPLLWVLWRTTGKRPWLRGFGMGWLAGFSFFLINLKWLNTVAWVGALVLPAYLALFWGAFGAFAATWGNPRRLRPGSLTHLLGIYAMNAAWWGSLEWLRSWLLTGFGWNGLGVALHGTLVLAQSADLIGVAGLSMVLVFINQTFAGSWEQRKLGGNSGYYRARGVVVGLLVLMVGYGFWREAQVKQKESINLQALLVQINAPQEAGRWLWDPVKVHLAYEDETERGLKQSGFVDWVIWPESALSGRLLTLADGSWAMWEENLESISRVRESGSFTLIQGMTELEGEKLEGQFVNKEDGRCWNSLVAMGPNNELQSFRKHHLVIFGETIPFVNEIPWLKKIYEQQSGSAYLGSFSEGERLEPLSLEAQNRKIGVIPSVCFEDTVPRLERKFVRDEPQVIVNVTNDGWFKESEAAMQHFNNAIFRAIELRRPMLRCANTGVSAAVSATGEVLGKLVDAKGSHFTSGSLKASVPVPLEPPFSLYALWGDWPVIGLGLLALAMGWRNRKPVISELPEAPES